MSHTPHQLTEEFPQMTDQIHALKQSNTHFSRLVDEYHVLNQNIYQAESDIEPTDDFNLKTMHKKRMRIKDEIYAILTA